MFYVFDNGGETLDRYTVIDKQGDMLALSETGAGVSMFAGNCVDNYMFHAYGYSWRERCNVKAIMKDELPRIIREFETDGNIGKRIKFSSLPKELKQHIYQRFE